MIQNSNSQRIFSRFLSQRTLFIVGIGWLGGISLFSAELLSADLAAAQTYDSSIDSIDNVNSAANNTVVPSAQDLLMQQPAEPLAEVAPAPTAEELVVPAAPEPIAPPDAAGSPSEPAIETLGSEPSSAEFSSPASSSSEALVSPNLEDNARAAFEQNNAQNSAQSSSSYIDSTPYSLGATRPDVVLSERSTGCQAVLQSGQAVPASICPPAPALGNYSTGSYAASAGSGSNYSGDYSGAVALPSVQDFYNLTVRPPRCWATTT